MQDLSGTDIKGYKLLERIGSGGFGAIYKAEQTTVGREVAMKVILPGFANQPDFIRRFETEAQVVARLEHLHIVPLYDYWRDPDGAYLVMRLLKGGSLRDALNDGAFDLRTTAVILDQVAAALDTAHRNAVIHRDIKPGNILLDEDGNAYLADFGIAKDLASLHGSKTQPDAVVGSLDYLAPEQARSEAVTPRTDIYSLGITLYEMLTGEHPFKGTSTVERLYKQLSDPLPQILTLDASLQETINAIIQKATAKDPAHRYPDVLALAAAFREGAGLNLSPREGSIVEQLTLREQEILQLITKAMSNKEIAEKLFVTVATVKWHINQLYQKLGVGNRVQAMIRARELALVIGEDSAERLVGLNGAPSVSLPEPENPYKGLRAFQTADARDFFGREELVDKLLKRLGDSERFGRFLAVIGPSGSGKSSLVKAGLIPALWRGKLPNSECWFVAEMLPGAHPLDELEVALMRVAATHADDLHEQLARDERGLLRIAQLILPNDGSELVLVVDQFEEVFTLGMDEAERQHFLNLLLAAVTDSRSRVRIIITLRADYYDRPLHYPEFGELVRSRMETLLPLGAKELERAILGPAERVAVTFEPGLVTQIVSEINYQAGALPLLQYALTEVFDRRQGRVLTHEVYQAVGGAGGALANRAEELYLSFDEAGREMARQMFLRLVTLGEGAEDTRRRVTRNELLAIYSSLSASLDIGSETTPIVGEDLMDEIIDAFANYRLLSLDNDPATRLPTVELAHEAILREWERLRVWLNDSRDDIKLQRQLSHATDEWLVAKGDASFLVTGSRLEMFEKWAKETQLALTPVECDFLNTSITEREQREVDETARQARESRLERRVVTFLRGLVAVLLLATLGAFGLAGVAINQSDIAAAERDKTEANFNLAERQRLAGLANILLQNDNSRIELASLLTIRSLNMGYSGEGDIAHSKVMAFSMPYLVIPTLQGNASVAFSPDGRYLLALGPEQKTVSLWDIQTGEIVRRFPTKGGVVKVDFSPDGRFVLIANRRRGELLDVQTGTVIHEINHDTCPSDTITAALAFSRNGLYLLASDGKGEKLILWNVETFEEVQHFSGYSDCMNQVAVSADGRLIVGEDGTGTVIIWDATISDPVRLLSPFPTDESILTNNLALSADGRYLLTSSGNSHEALLWDTQTGRQARAFHGHTAAIVGVDFSPDGRYAVTASLDATVRLWDLETGVEVTRYGGCGERCTAVAFSPDSRYVAATGDSDSATSQIALWDTLPQSPLPILIGHTDEIVQALYSPDGRYILTVSKDNTARLWDAQTGAPLRIFAGHTDQLQAATFSFDGRMVLTSSYDMTAIVWSTDTGEVLHKLNVGTVGTDVALSPDGTHFAMACEITKTALLYSLQSGEKLSSFSAEVSHVDFAPDGNSILTVSAGSKAQVWDVNTRQTTLEISFEGDRVTDAVFSPDGQYFLTTGSDGLTSIWNPKTGELIRDFPGHAIEATRVAFSADSRVLLTSTTEGTVHLWEMETNKELRRLSGPYGTLSLDGRFVLTYGNGNTAQVWPVDYRESVNYLCSRLGRDVTDIERRQYGITDDAPTCPKFATDVVSS